jgi:2-oxoglutarate dehydrogenase E2 component (dihydrolipoamide succinyltransferase)
MPIELKVPEVGESITEVYIGEWRKSVGDRVEVDEELVELESEKATFDAPAPASGVLAKILKKSGETAEVGEVIAYIDESGKEPRDFHKTSEAESRSMRAVGSGDQERSKSLGSDGNQADQPKKPAKTPEQKEEHKERLEPAVTPTARRLIREHGLHPEDVPPAEPGGRVRAEDVERFLEHESKAGESQKPTAGELGRQTESVPMTGIRRRIAQRLVEAQKNAALLTTFNEIDMTAVNELRRKHRDAFQEKYGIKLGFMSFFVKAAVDALNQLPQLNARIDGTNIIYHNYCDVGVAIGSDKGLVVPVLRNAERMSFAEIETTIDDLGRRARDGKLSVEELQGGTFTISNGGIYGSLLSTPIVNPPQSGVLGMHAIQDRPVVRDGQIVIRPMMYVALSYDHRIVDGREAVTFLKRIRDAIEEPARMLLEI